MQQLPLLPRLHGRQRLRAVFPDQLQIHPVVEQQRPVQSAELAVRGQQALRQALRLLHAARFHQSREGEQPKVCEQSVFQLCIRRNREPFLRHLPVVDASGTGLMRCELDPHRPVRGMIAQQEIPVPPVRRRFPDPEGDGVDQRVRDPDDREAQQDRPERGQLRQQRREREEHGGEEQVEQDPAVIVEQDRHRSVRPQRGRRHQALSRGPADLLALEAHTVPVLHPDEIQQAEGRKAVAGEQAAYQVPRLMDDDLHSQRAIRDGDQERGPQQVRRLSDAARQPVVQPRPKLPAQDPAAYGIKQKREPPACRQLLLTRPVHPGFLPDISFCFDGITNCPGCHEKSTAESSGPRGIRTNGKPQQEQRRTQQILSFRGTKRHGNPFSYSSEHSLTRGDADCHGPVGASQ